MRKIIIGVMGPGAVAEPEVRKVAYSLGEAIAKQGWVLLTGGGDGVMHYASKGASENKGFVLAVLRVEDPDQANEFVDIAIPTGIGSARNNINVLTSDVVVACSMGPGTASEVALAIKSGKNVILLSNSDQNLEFFRQFSSRLVHPCETVEDAIEKIKFILLEEV